MGNGALKKDERGELGGAGAEGYADLDDGALNRVKDALELALQYNEAKGGDEEDGLTSARLAVPPNEGK